MRTYALVFLLLMFGSITHAIELTFTVSHHYNKTPLRLDSFRYKTASSETYSISRLSYLLSSFKLEKHDGSIIELPNQHAWIDLKDKTKFTLKNIPKGNYRAFHFNVGLTPEINLLNPSIYAMSHPLSSSKNLHWSLGDGYIFLALEGQKLMPNRIKQGFVYHLANDSNLTSITLPYQFKIQRDTSANILFDIQTLFNSPSPIDILADGNISHSNEGDTIAKKLTLNLKNSFSINNFTSARKSNQTAKNVKPLYLPKSFTPYPFTIPRRIPVPDLPPDNPLTVDRVNLGKILFHDTRLSLDNSINCASCHQAQHAFSDPKEKSIGVNKAQGIRNSMPLQNLAWKKRFFWDGRVSSLREQVLFPITDKSEMHQDIVLLPAKINDLYPHFEKAFGPGKITAEKIALALEAHLLTMTSLDSRFERAMKGKAKLTAQEQRGFELFFTENEPRNNKLGADCFHCHSGPFFSDDSYHDTGLPSMTDSGLMRITNKQTDQFKFLTPSLRNVSLTAPYMHDGRLKTLEDVIDHYNHTHSKTPNLDPNLSKHGNKGLQLTKEDKAALVAFLKTLTDPKFKQVK